MRRESWQCRALGKWRQRIVPRRKPLWYVATNRRHTTHFGHELYTDTTVLYRGEKEERRKIKWAQKWSENTVGQGDVHDNIKKNDENIGSSARQEKNREKARREKEINKFFSL